MRADRRGAADLWGGAAEGEAADRADRRYGYLNAWAEYAAIFARTRAAHAEHESAKTELKALVPEDAREAYGHGVRAKRSRAGAISLF